VWFTLELEEISFLVIPVSRLENLDMVRLALRVGGGVEFRGRESGCEIATG